MSKVFEALRRQQQNQSTETDRDPLAAETRASGESSPDPAEGFELPSAIGAPVGPRSNEGALFSAPPVREESPTLPRTANTPAPPPVAPRSNGKTAAENASAGPAVQPAQVTPSTAPVSHPAQPARNGVTHKATPVIRRPALSVEAPPEPTPAIEQPEETLAPHAPREIPIEHLSPTQLHPRLILLTEPQTPECEQYRTLRTQIFHAAEKKTTQVIAITSALAGEGKTSTVLNLALAIAQSQEKRVLVIDGDLRRPNVSAYLGVKRRLGLGDVLNGDSETLDAIFGVADLELYVLPVTREALNPTELLSRERFSDMIANLREYFDFILIDSPPVLPFADARLLSNHADAVLLVVRAGLASYDTVEKAIGMLPANRILGVVLNGADHPDEANYYDYYYNYSHGRPRPHTWWEKLKHRLRSDRRKSSRKLTR